MLASGVKWSNMSESKLAFIVLGIGSIESGLAVPVLEENWSGMLAVADPVGSVK